MELGHYIRYGTIICRCVTNFSQSDSNSNAADSFTRC